LTNKNFFLFILITISVYTASLYLYHEKLEQGVVHQAIQSANDVLRNNEATKTFIDETLKEKLDKLKENGSLDKEVFLSELYSSTYVTTKINEHYNNIRRKEELEPIIIKFVAENPKNFMNGISEKEELDILRAFQDKKINSYHKVIDNEDGTKTLYYAKPTPPLQKNCLECHGNPSEAPDNITKAYGTKRGFYHQEGETRAFIKILMPLSQHLEQKNKLFWTSAIGSFVSILIIFFLVGLFIRKSKKNTQKLQSIIDTLSEIVIVKTSTKFIFVNNSFLDFFHVKNFKEFEKKHECLSADFSQENNTLHLDFKNLDDKTIEKLNTIEKARRIIKIPNHANELKTLTITINKLDHSNKEYVIVLSDITQLQNKAEMLEKKANIDSLTQIYTRQKFDEFYILEFHRSQRYINSLSLLFLDIDHFKEINDIYGHDVGDKTLKDFASIINTQIRQYDVFARWGGEEFMLMLPQTDVNAAFKMAEKIRKIVSTHKFETIETLTCSIGVSMLQKDDTHQSLIKRADNALYKAKNTGRNKTIIDF
jgi:diguanylate cyclase (GGDEF)-like protein